MALSHLLTNGQSRPLLDIASKSYEAYQHYVRPDLNHLPIQTRGADGRPIDVIPAMPDADPLYHTGLSLIDVLTLT